MSRRGPAPIEVNNLFRENTTGISFFLALGKTQTTALVLCDLAREHNEVGFASAYSRWVPGIHGCRQKGLVEHHPEVLKDGQRPSWAEIYTFTRAGELVLDLLRVAGVYQEIAGTYRLRPVESVAS